MHGLCNSFVCHLNRGLATGIEFRNRGKWPPKKFKAGNLGNQETCESEKNSGFGAEEEEISKKKKKKKKNNCIR
jgi:hypothetical protein